MQLRNGLSRGGGTINACDWKHVVSNYFFHFTVFRILPNNVSYRLGLFVHSVYVQISLYRIRKFVVDINLHGLTQLASAF
jgi:hypothetical protein